MKSKKLFLSLLALFIIGIIKAQNITFSVMKTIVEFSDYAPAGNYIAALGYDHKTIDVKENYTSHGFKSLKISCVWNDDKYDYDYYNYMYYYSPNNTTTTKSVSFVTKCSYQFNNLLKEILAQGFYLTEEKTGDGGSQIKKYKSESHPGLTIFTTVSDTDTEDIYSHRVSFYY